MKKLLLILLLAGLSGYAQTYSPLLAPPKMQFLDGNGLPCSGCLLYSYQAGTTTPLATYTDATGATQNQNPVQLDASGYATVFLKNQAYKLKLTTAAGVPIYTVDNYSVGDASWLRLNAANGPLAGSLSVTGNITVTGTISAPTIEGVKYADQYASLQSAIAAACGAPPAALYLPVATYTGIFTIPSGCNNVAMRGAGEGLSIIKLPNASAANANALANLGAISGWTFSDLTFDGNKANQTQTGQHCLYLDGVSGSSFAHLEFKNGFGGSASCFQISDAADNTVNHDLQLSDIYAHDNGTYANNADGLAIGATDSTIDGFKCSNNGDSCIGGQGLGTARISISNVQANNNMRTCTVAFGPGANSDISVSGVNAVCPNTNNPYGGFFSGVTRFSWVGGNITVTGATAASAAETLHIENSTDANVTGLHINGSTGDCIGILSTGAGTTADISLTGVVATNCSKHALQINAQGSSLNGIYVSGGSLKNASQSSPGTYDDLFIGLTAGSGQRVVIDGTYLGDDQGTHTTKYCAEMGGPAYVGFVTFISPSCVGFLTGAFNNIAPTAHIVGGLGAFVGAAGDLTMLRLGDASNMSASEQRKIQMFGEDALSVNREFDITNNGSDTTLGNAAGTGGFDFGVKDGHVQMAATPGSNQNAVIQADGTGAVILSGSFIKNNAPNQLEPLTVGTLPAATSVVGAIVKVSDSTAITAEGQTCVGGGTTAALAFSTGTIWKCF